MIPLGARLGTLLALEVSAAYGNAPSATPVGGHQEDQCRLREPHRRLAHPARGEGAVPAPGTSSMQMLLATTCQQMMMDTG
jgi:hypothetical protein